MANKSVKQRASEAAARTKKALAKAEVRTDNFLIRLASSPYTVGIVVGVIAALVMVWVW